MVEIPDAALALGTVGTIIGFFTYIWRTGRAWTKMEDKLEANNKEIKRLEAQINELQKKESIDHAEVKQLMREIWQQMNKDTKEILQRLAKLEAKD